MEESMKCRKCGECFDEDVQLRQHVFTHTAKDDITGIIYLNSPFHVFP